MMKKYLCLLVLLCLCLTGCAGEPEETTVPTESAAPEPATKTVYVHASITKEYGAAVSRTEFLFDETDRVTQVVIYSNDAEQMRYSVECDENGNYTRWSATVSGMESVTEYTYDAQGHSLGSSVYMGGTLMSATVYTWEGDLRTSITTTMPAQNMEQRAVMTYDETGRLIRQDTYVDGTLNSYAVCTTDEQGRLLTTASYQADGTAVSTTTYTYDAATETRVTTDPDGSVTQQTVLTYDEAANLLTSTVSDGDGNVLSSETHVWKAVEVPIGCPRASV